MVAFLRSSVSNGPGYSVQKLRDGNCLKIIVVFNPIITRLFSRFLGQVGISDDVS